jgi:hypothetical protein
MVWNFQVCYLSAKYYSGIRCKENVKESSFCLIGLPVARITERLGDSIAVLTGSVGRDLIVRKNRELPKGILKGYWDVIACTASRHANVNERWNTVPDAKESGRDLCFEMRESAKNPIAESNADFWLIAACTCEYQEALSHALLDAFTKVWSDDQIGSLCPSNKVLLIPGAFYSNADAVFRRMVPKDFGRLSDRSKVEWAMQFSRTPAVRTPDCEGLVGKDAIYLVRSFPGSNLFSYCQSDSLRELRAR